MQSAPHYNRIWESTILFARKQLYRKPKACHARAGGQPFFYMNFLYVRCVSPKLNSRTLNQPNRHLISQRAILIYFSAKLEMVALLAVAFKWAHRTGELQNEKKPIKINKQGWPAVSLYRAIQSPVI